MFVLQIIQGPYKGQAIPLSQGSLVVVGRGEVCDVRLEDRQLSTVHAEFYWNEDGFGIHDLKSTNGTLLNGARVEGKVGLRIGDHVQLGGVIFQLREVDVATDGIELLDTGAPPPAGMLALGNQRTEIAAQMQRPPPLPAAAVGPGAKTQPKILGLGPMKTVMSKNIAAAVVDDEVVGGIAGLKAKVESGAGGAKIVVERDDRLEPFWVVPVAIGREHASGIVLEDRSVSLRHAVVDFRDGAFRVRDVGSSNGIHINGQRVVDEVLHDGDVISVGAYAIIVVLGEGCLGLSVQPPQLRERDAPRTRSGAALGVVSAPLGDGKRKKKKASDLVWYATSDLDRGVFRGRAAFLALLLGMVLTGWMLGLGDSETLAGNQLGDHHEGAEFLAQAETFGRDRCTACHIGAGRIATLKCLDCHADSRPTTGHVQADLPCNGCHLDHKGPDYESAAAAALSCTECHGSPHDQLRRLKPKLVTTFDIEAEGDVEFHLKHDGEGVKCLDCHDPAAASRQRGIRGSCGGCHAPEHPVAKDCQLCHTAHPDRDPPPFYETVTPVEPPRFAATGLVWTFGLLVLSFAVAGMLPRRRKVEVEMPEERV